MEINLVIGIMLYKKMEINLGFQWSAIQLIGIE